MKRSIDKGDVVHKIIVEGADCTGKTTYAKMLAGSNKSLLHYGVHSELDEQAQLMFFRSLMDLPAEIVFDRSPISEYVYSKYRGSKSWFTFIDIEKLIKQEYGNCKIYFLIPNKKLVKKICGLTDQPSWVVDNIIDIYSDYLLLANFFKNYNAVHIIDTTEQLESAVTKLEKVDDNNLGL